VQVDDATGKEGKKMVFFTNRQTTLFDKTNIHKLLQAFDLPPPKLVIRLMSVGGGAQTRAYGMVRAFKLLKREKDDDGKYSESYCEEWRKVLRIQAENAPNTGLTQDCLPDPAFLSDTNSDKAAWNLESFMRDVVVPLAAENNALVIGLSLSLCHVLLLSLFRCLSLSFTLFSSLFHLSISLLVNLSPFF